MHVLHAIVQGTDESREMVVVLRMLLSLSHTHTSKIEDRSLMYTQRIGTCLCLTHAWSFAHSHLSMSLSHAHRLHIALPPQHTYGHIHTFSLSHTHKISIKKTRAHLKRPNPNKHELELNSNIWKYCSVKNFHKKKSWVIFEDCFHTHKKVRWMSFKRDTVTHRSIDRAAAVHALAQDSVSWLWYQLIKALPKSNVYVY